jgi:hypothetical protein
MVRIGLDDPTAAAVARLSVDSAIVANILLEALLPYPAHAKTFRSVNQNLSRWLFWAGPQDVGWLLAADDPGTASLRRRLQEHPETPPWMLGWTTDPKVLPLIRKRQAAARTDYERRMYDAPARACGAKPTRIVRISATGPGDYPPESVYPQPPRDHGDGSVMVLVTGRILMPDGDWLANGFIGLLGAGDKLEGALEQETPTGDFDDDTYKRYVGFVNYYIHQVNLMRHLLGEDYAVKYADPSGVLLAIESDSGVAGTIEMAPYRTTVAWEEEALVAFEKGYLKLRLPAPLAVNRAGELEIYADPGDGAEPVRTFPTMPWVGAMQQQAANFVSVCRGEMAPPCDAATAVKDLTTAADYINLLTA